MKVTINKESTNELFKPFTLNIEVETIEEARLLYHVANRTNLLKVLQLKGNHYGFDAYSKDIASQLDGEDIIEEEIMAQGFEI